MVAGITEIADLAGRYSKQCSKKTGREYWKLEKPGLFQWAYGVAKHYSIEGGVMIFHPYRLKVARGDKADCLDGAGRYKCMHCM